MPTRRCEGVLGFRQHPPSPVDIVRGLMSVMSLDRSYADRHRSDRRRAQRWRRFRLRRGAGFYQATYRRSARPGEGNESRNARSHLSLSSWEIITTQGPDPLAQRFTTAHSSAAVQSDVFVRKLITDRLAPAYAKAGITPKQRHVALHRRRDPQRFRRHDPAHHPDALLMSTANDVSPRARSCRATRWAAERSLTLI